MSLHLSVYFGGIKTLLKSGNPCCTSPAPISLAPDIENHPPIAPTPDSKSTALVTLLPDVENLFRRYIYDQIPIRLILLPEMRLLERDALITHVRPGMGSITEEAVRTRQNRTPAATREHVIIDMIKEQVRYAIFSHRWFSEGEPTYQDMMKGNRLGGAGYEKLKQFCDTAQSARVTYAWSDTCCINKDSSAELDESIRSMFRWYRNSFICIAYLGNTDCLDNVGDDEWFRRGWTLQELIAPKCIKFYGRKWNPLTDVVNDLDHWEILKKIENVTTIRAHFLRGRQFEPGPKDIAERMSWAAGRTTTRGEDRAYSLMGIFGVSMSVAYGEGPDQAFFRLTEAILHVSDSLDILNWTGAPASTSHATRMLPSSPDCYLMKNRPKFSALQNPQSLTLTNRGLQLDLFVIPGTLSPENLQNSNRAIFRPDRTMVVEDAVTVEGSVESVNKGQSCQYAIGVWNIVQDVNRGLVTPHEVTGCLMFRLLPGPWKKIPLKEYIKLTPSPELFHSRLLLERVFL
ncbi:hypothetical protein HD554DRAFT_2111690 [Boletus coccyginus]|nr:hypothetical protein HD554DRAFT_2111690 [Boletus coccyginus]